MNIKNNRALSSARLLIIIIIMLIKCNGFALEKVDSLLKRAEKSTPKEQINIYIQIAREVFGVNDTLSINYARKAALLSEQLNRKRDEAIALTIIGTCQNRLSMDSTSLVTLQNALNIFKNTNCEPIDILKCYSSLGVTYYSLGNFNKSLEYNLQALSIAQKHKIKDHESLILYNIGNQYLSQNEYALALEYFLNSLKIEEEQGNQEGIAYCYNDLAHIYQTIGMDSIADDCYQKSLDFFIQKKYLFEQAIVYNNLGDLYSSRKIFDKAEVNFRKAISIKTKLGNTSSLALSCSRFGDMFFYKGVMDSAGYYFQKAIQYAELSGRSQYKASALLGYGKLLANGKSFKNAEKALVESEAIAKSLGLNEIRHDALIILSKIDSSQKKYEQSRERLSIAYSLDKYLNKEITKRQMAEMSVKYETEKKEKEIKNQQSLVKKQRTIMLGLILFAALVIALITLVYRQYAIKKKNNILLAKQKAEIDAKNQKLSELDELKTRFFTNISHELRTPLTIITGNLEMLYDKEEQTGQDTTNYQTMLRHSRRLLDLINQLLEISKLEKGKMRLSLQHGNISQFVKLLASSYSSWSSELRINFTYNEIDEDIVGWFDADKLEKIIVNLLSNAFKFTPAQGTVVLTLKSTTKDYKISISDTGEGLNEKELSNIWELFYQGNSKTNRLFEGSGIGLTLVKELVQTMNGKINVSSQVGKGTKFEFTIPLSFEPTENIDILDQSTSFIFEKPNLPRVASAYSETENLTKDSDQDLVLVVEDNEDLRYFIASNLHSKYRIVEAQDGKEGLEKAFETIPDLIISDVMMPEMDGLELTSKLKNDERTSHIPVVLLTAKVSPDNVIEGLQSGADEYLPKPFSIKELSLRIRNLLTTRQQLRDRFDRTPDINLAEIKISSLDDKLLQRALNFIEQHMDDSDYEVVQFCNDMGMSRTNLHRKLKAITNQSATEFIRNVRLRRAAMLLRNNAGNVSEVAYQTGFNNLSYFAKSFKELFGVSPSEYIADHKS